MTEPLRWQVRVQPERSLIHLTTTLTLNDGDVFSLPAWIPGSYLVREFVRGVQDLALTGEDGAPITFRKLAKAAWQVSMDTTQRVTLRYSVYGRELTVRTAHIDTTHAFFNGANAFMRFQGLDDVPVAVAVTPPEGWQAFVSLPRHDDAFLADNYVHLADTVFEIGPHRVHYFTIDEVPHRLIFWGDAALAIDLPRLERDIRDLVRENMRTFDGPLPYARYDFIFHISPDGRGGLEHRDSTTLAVSWASFETKDGYLDLLTLIAHEHFHAWNGRRLTPASLEYPEFDKENYVEELWVVEGFTSYFDELNTLRAGKMDVTTWLDRQAKSLTALEKTYGRHRQSLVESSFDAWIRLYRPYEHTRNQTVSYYLKGALVAFAIDLRLRAATDNERTLDDVLRELWRRWNQGHHAYTSAEVFSILGALGGEDVARDARLWVTSTTPPHFESLLDAFGITLVTATDANTDFGFEFTTEQGNAVVASVDEGRIDAVGELLPGDEIVALNGRRVRADELRARLQRLYQADPTQHVPVLLFRMGHAHHATIHLSPAFVRQLRVKDAVPNALQRWFDALPGA